VSSSPVPPNSQSPAPLTYRQAGVDIDAGNALVERIKPAVARTRRAEVLGALGGFGALFRVPIERYAEPVLVSGTDGVGTKLKLAQQYGRHDGIGIDLVGMCVNDVLVQGAEPLYFLDYFACGRLDVDTAARVIEGIAAGCELAGCALTGGETAEMPDMYDEGEYDLAGFCVGVVERRKIIDGSQLRAGDQILGLGSSGPHSNGYSLIRKILQRCADPAAEQVGGQPLLDALLTPTRIYVRSVLDLLARFDVRAMAHITGGGLTENIIRVVPEGLAVQLDARAWPRPPVFDWLAATGGVVDSEMARTFNLGIGYAVIVAPELAADVSRCLQASGEQVWMIGEVVEQGAGERVSWR
jgi:phosphoribosylformylglycinamidine cyclo-ligase